MRAVINYNNTIVSASMLDVDDVGNVCIIGKRAGMEEHYLIIETSMGITTIFEYGPIYFDSVLCDNTYCSISKMTYNDSKLSKFLDRWLTDPKKHIVEAEVIEDKNIILDKCVDLIQYMRG